MEICRGNVPHLFWLSQQCGNLGGSHEGRMDTVAKQASFNKLRRCNISSFVVPEGRRIRCTPGIPVASEEPAKSTSGEHMIAHTFVCRHIIVPSFLFYRNPWRPMLVRVLAHEWRSTARCSRPIDESFSHARLKNRF